jgi:hypothetical protein
LQYFLSQSTWDADEVNRRRLELLVNDPATAPHARGVIAIDDSGDRKDGTATAHDPPPPNPGELRVLVLLGHLLRPTIHKRQHRHSPGIRP